MAMILRAVYRDPINVIDDVHCFVNAEVVLVIDCERLISSSPRSNYSDNIVRVNGDSSGLIG